MILGADPHWMWCCRQGEGRDPCSQASGSGSRDSEELTQLNPPWWISQQRHATVAQKCQDNLYLIFSSPPPQGVTQPTSEVCLQACGGRWSSLALLSTKHQTLILATRTLGRIWMRENRQNLHTMSYLDRIFDPERFFIHCFGAWTWRIMLSSNLWVNYQKRHFGASSQVHFQPFWRNVVWKYWNLNHNLIRSSEQPQPLLFPRSTMD